MSSSRSGAIKGMPHMYISGHCRRNYKDRAGPVPKEFYVYMYRRSESTANGVSGSPYYVGKGAGNRAWSNEGRSVRRPSKREFIKIVSSGMREKDAFQLEMLLIFMYGRIDLKTGILHNKSDGGEGPSGWSSEAKQKLSIRQKQLWNDPRVRERWIKAMRRNSENSTRPKVVKTGRKRGDKWLHPMPEETRKKISAAKMGHKSYPRKPHVERHGTTSEYAHGCRCTKCRVANASYKYALNHRNDA